MECSFSKSVHIFFLIVRSSALYECANMLMSDYRVSLISITIKSTRVFPFHSSHARLRQTRPSPRSVKSTPVLPYVMCELRQTLTSVDWPLRHYLPCQARKRYHYVYNADTYHLYRVQELCKKSRWLAVLGSLSPNSSYGLCGRKATLNCSISEFGSCVKSRGGWPSWASFPK